MNEPVLAGPPDILREVERILAKHIVGLSLEQIEGFFGILLTPADLPELTYGKVLAHQLVTKACGGDLKAMAEIFDRVCGKPVQVNRNINENYTYINFLEECKRLDDEDAEKKSRVIEASFVPAPPDPRRMKEQEQMLEDLGQ